MSEENDRFAPPGKVWVCLACGKISPHDKYGDKNSNKLWDVSCVMNAILSDEDKLIKDENGRVKEITK